MASNQFLVLERELDTGDSFRDLYNYSVSGWRKGRNQRAVEARKKAVYDCAKFIEEARRLGGHRGDAMMQEAFSTSDYVLAFTWYTDLLTLNAYKETDTVWDQFFKRSTLPDYRAARRDRVEGLDTPMSQVAQLADYKHDANLSGTSDATLQVYKYGRIFLMSFEATINDVLKTLTDIPSRFAKAARRTERYVAAATYVANGTLYTSGHGNKGTAKLNVENLTTALTVMDSQLDTNGNPIDLGMVRLVVGPALKRTAQRILNADKLIFDTNPSAGTAKVRYETANYIAPELQLVVDRYIPILDSTYGANSWYLFADPAVLQVGEVAFLQGHETPELFMQSPDAVRVSDNGGASGLANPLDGTFANDSIAFKIRHNVGATTYEYRASYWSDGSA